LGNYEREVKGVGEGATLSPTIGVSFSPSQEIPPNILGASCLSQNDEMK